MSQQLLAWKRVLVFLGVALLVVLAGAAPLWAQGETATISGTATDPSGAALAGAKIVVTNAGTGLSQTTATDARGRYSVPQLAVGAYTARASQSGFQTVVHSGITLSVGGAVVVDFALPVGQVSQTVNVEGQVSNVETSTSEISALVSPQQMRNLPLNGRNYEQLLTLAPGVATIAPAVNFVTGRLYGMQNNYAISGSRPTGQAFLMDYTDVRDFWEHGVGSGYAGTSLGVESIAEFQVLTNSYDAEFSGNGVVMNMVTRSGTNDFHGAVYDFMRNNVLDARAFQDPASGPPPFRQNQFGGALGGPIKKDKLFFFVNYEGIRNSLATTISGLTIPEPYVAQGKLPCSTFSLFALPSVTPPAGCPSSPSGPPGSSNNPIVSDPNAKPQAEAIAALYGLCKGCRPIAFNGAPVGTDLGGYYNVSTAPPLVNNEDWILGRVDYNLGTNDSMFGRYAIDDARVINNPQDPLGIFPELDFTRNQYLTVTERHIVSATMVNSLRLGYVRTNENSSTALGLSAGQLSAAGLTLDPLDFQRTLFNEPFRPDGQVSPYGTGAISSVGPNPDRPDTLVDSKFSGGDDLVWTHGSHSIKVGGVVTRVQINNTQVAYSAGGAYIVNFTLANFLEGSPFLAFGVPQGFANADRYFREIDMSPYIQDDWKVSSRLTLNLGMRYDYATNPVGWAGGGQPLTAVKAIKSFEPLLGPVTPPTFRPGKPQTLFTPVKHAFASNPNTANWDPRFGFAYDPFADHKTSIRGGVGIFHDPAAARIYESSFIATPPALSSLVFFPPFPNPNGAPIFSPDLFASVAYQDPWGSPYDIQYNFSIQRELGAGTVFTIGYVGDLGRHLWNQRDINPPMCTTYPNCSALPQIPTSLPAVSNATYTVSNSCVSVAPLPPQTSCYGSGVQFPFVPGAAGPRINPNFGYVVTESPTAASSYNSLQVGLTHQFGKNFSGQAYYTWSHCIDDGSFATSLEEFAQLQTNPYNQSYDYGNCIFDIRHNLSVNGLYMLPFKGNRFVQGWQFGGILAVQSGFPINVYNGASTDPASIQTEWASRLNYSFAAGCHPNQILDKTTSTPGQPGSVQWFNTNCYQPQAPGFLGNVGRNSVPGPGLVNLDFSIIKNTQLRENLNMQFRCEAFNVMNHFNPAPPGGAIDLANGLSGISLLQEGTPRQIQFALKFEF